MYIASQAPIVVGNGYVAAMTWTGVMNVAGACSPGTSTRRRSRCVLPCRRSGMVPPSPPSQHRTRPCKTLTSAIDVGASAVCNRAAGVVWGCSCRGASARNTLGLTENLLENTTGVGEPPPVHILSER